MSNGRVERSKSFITRWILAYEPLPPIDSCIGMGAGLTEEVGAVEDPWSVPLIAGLEIASSDKIADTLDIKAGKSKLVGRESSTIRALSPSGGTAEVLLSFLPPITLVGS